MKIVAFSDIHGQKLPEIPDCDVLIFAGDYSALGSWEESSRFVNTFDKLPGKHKVLVPGNHDYQIEFTNMKNVKFYDDFVIEDKYFLTCSYTPEYGGWNYEFSEERLNNMMSVWPIDVNVLITHGPPYGILDKNKEGEHCGCHALRKYVDRAKPDVHIFGHIHHSFGHIERNGTKFYNVSLLDDGYTYVNPLTEIDYVC
jgi:Icc-related predicted phosphoesterase